MAYSWPSHCKRYLDAIEAEKRYLRSQQVHLYSNTLLPNLLGSGPTGTELTLPKHGYDYTVVAVLGADLLRPTYMSRSL